MWNRVNPWKVWGRQASASSRADTGRLLNCPEGKCLFPPRNLSLDAASAWKDSSASALHASRAARGLAAPATWPAALPVAWSAAAPAAPTHARPAATPRGVNWNWTDANTFRPIDPRLAGSSSLREDTASPMDWREDARGSPMEWAPSDTAATAVNQPSSERKWWNCCRWNNWQMCAKTLQLILNQTYLDLVLGTHITSTLVWLESWSLTVEHVKLPACCDHDQPIIVVLHLPSASTSRLRVLVVFHVNCSATKVRYL